jgi:hypothetical protein
MTSNNRNGIIHLFSSILLSLTALFFSISNTFSQWEPDVRLTNNSAVSYTSNNNSYCIGTTGDSIFIVWEDGRDGNDEIYFKRSTDAGITWGADIRVTANTGLSALPVIAVSGPVIHVVWFDNTLGNNEIFYRRSTDAGNSWQGISRLTNDPAFSEMPSILVNGSSVHVVWDDFRDNNQEIYYIRSTDGGATWGLNIRLTNNPGTSGSPGIISSGNYLYLVWHDNKDGNPEIYFKLSVNDGSIWGPDIRLTNNPGDSFYPSISAAGSLIHVVWHDNRDGNPEIYYKRSTTNGENWGPDVRLTNSNGDSFNPVVLASLNAVHVTWVDDRDVNEQIYYKISTDAGITWGNDQKLTHQTFPDAYFPSIAVSGSAVHLVWQDERDGNWEIYYKRNPTGNPIGLQNISSEIPKAFILNQNYPNPFNPATVIEFSVPKASNISLSVYDITGRVVSILVNEELKAGMYKFNFDAEGLSSGVYIYKLETDGYIGTKKMLLIK